MIDRQAGESGFRLTISTGFDFTGYSSLKIRERDPSGVITDHVASTDDASSGKLYFVVPDAQYDTPGEYQFQAFIDMGGGKELISRRRTVHFLTSLSAP